MFGISIHRRERFEKLKLVLTGTLLKVQFSTSTGKAAAATRELLNNPRHGPDEYAGQTSDQLPDTDNGGPHKQTHRASEGT